MYVNKWAVAQKAPAAPAIDGVLAETIWSGSAILDDFRAVYTNEPVQDGPSYRLAYDSSHLYFGGSFASADRSDLEKIELLISAQQAGEPHYVVSVPVTALPRKTATDWNVGREIVKQNPQRTNVNAFTLAMTDAGGRTSVELSVPWSAFGLSAPEEGAEWRVNVVHVYRLGTKPLLTWVPVRTSTYWDTGTTVTIKANIVDEGRLGTVYFGRPKSGASWKPERARLRYDSFTRKTLSFERSGAADAQ
ncbi:MAG: Carbohydrate family 9 binding domain-like, partial [Paenibacillus sp.]|nr:Carbohydrate family 9 binding domain-like [Paenibacillus sp.]